MDIGTATTRQISIKVCKLCNSAIGDTGLCTYDCPNDGDLRRDAGSVWQRVYVRTDVLISEVEI